MRLTKKDIAYITSGANIIEIPDIVEGHKYTGQAIIKLGQLEDIEEELGIDLITLFNTYINGFYVKGEIEKQYIDFENPLNSIAFKNGEMFYRHKWSYQYVKLKDYGKTWALTKEELL